MITLFFKKENQLEDKEVPGRKIIKTRWIMFWCKMQMK